MADISEIVVKAGNITTTDASENQDIKAMSNKLDPMSQDVKAIRNFLENMSNKGLPSQSTGQTNFRQVYQSMFGGSNYNNLKQQGATSNNRPNGIYRSNESNDEEDATKLKGGFLDNFEKVLSDAFLGSSFKEDVGQVFDDLAKKLGVSVKEIPSKVGQLVGKNVVKNNPAFAQLAGSVNIFKQTALSQIKSGGTEAIKALNEGNNAKALAAIRTTGSNIAKAGGQLGKQLLTLGPQLVPVIVGMKLLDTALTGLVDVAKSLAKAFTAYSQAANRDQESRKQNLKYAEERMRQDYNVLVEQPFKLLKEAAESVMDSWKNNLTLVSATQGYTKSDVQDLMSAIASRLQSEGLSSYISGTNIYDNLAKVINEGLSGAIAEEFAYQATILNKAVPTQDFFSYASTYASIAANAVRMGESQEQAIQKANKTLQEFASGLLYASRELSGGFSTGLKNASSIYEQSAKIAQAARSENMAAISSVLLAAQSYIGAVAPDLANSIVDSISKALIGGNASDIVALRSLAGINASNTEFLREFANDPKKIFANLFQNLAKMYNDSTDAYMEKAEGYAQLFGLSVEAFQRVDFQGLADAIRSMTESSTSLDANMQLLMQGETTTTAEQLKAQEINKYLLEEGLSYVIDNEAAQLIQQHMWEEQEKRELMEATYAVNLSESNMEVFEAIKNLVNNILNFLNPFAWAKKLGNLITTSDQGFALSADTLQMLELGKVGQGNLVERSQLTTYNANLNLTRSLVDMMGGRSLYEKARKDQQTWNQLTNPISYGSALGTTIGSIASSETLTSYAKTSSPTSKYSWGSVSKSQARSVQDALMNNVLNLTNDIISSVAASTDTASKASASAQVIKSRLEKMLSDEYIVNQFVKEHKSYEDWAASGSRYGIANMTEALQTAGYSEADVRQYFQDKETEAGAAELHSIQEQEKAFRDRGMKFWDEDFPVNYQDPLFLKADTVIETLGKIHTVLSDTISGQQLKDIIEGRTAFFAKYRDEWLAKQWPKLITTNKRDAGGGLLNQMFEEFMRYFAEHYYYSGGGTYRVSGYTYEDVAKKQAEKAAQDRGDTINALAEMLTNNLLDLTDPTRQTNALLAQILIIVTAIQNQTNDINSGKTVTSTLVESIQAMALGLSTGDSEAYKKLLGNDSTIM